MSCRVVVFCGLAGKSYVHKYFCVFLKFFILTAGKTTTEYREGRTCRVGKKFHNLLALENFENFNARKLKFKFKFLCFSGLEM